MMASLKESLAGPGYVILNAVRVMNIIVFLDIIAAHVVMLVKINLLTSFFFFEAVAHAIAIGVSSKELPLACSIRGKHANRHSLSPSLRAPVFPQLL